MPQELQTDSFTIGLLPSVPGPIKSATLERMADLLMRSGQGTAPAPDPWGEQDQFENCPSWGLKVPRP